MLRSNSQGLREVLQRGMQPSGGLVSFSFGVIGFEICGLNVQNLICKVQGLFELSGFAPASTQIQQQMDVELVEGHFGDPLDGSIGDDGWQFS